MSQGPETRFIASVHRLLPKSVYFEKMHNEYRGGTPDVWYSGPKSDLWVEYKWQTVPKSGVIKPALSELQKLWLRGREAEGRNVRVIVGTPSGGAIFPTPLTWESGGKCSFRTKESIAEYITQFVAGEVSEGSR